MKTVLFLISFVIMNVGIQFNSLKTNTETFDLKVKFTHVSVEAKGEIYVAMYNNETDFMTSNMYRGEIVKVTDEEALFVVFKELPKGEYAISAFHDVNGNKTMDFDANGMPKEAWATSGNASKYEVPSWSSTKIALNENREIELQF